ncbi:START domain-containing protein [Mucilaginibacter paludis]|uniref:Lipid-binding START domain protein n=1 Tax=Mucilaginibacter paludis DSM 18603 TaxID=714943 RepID=H1YHB5_9SPHI|nr:START domain-containing protein [Mucilaginibacter paludis]EHQ25449.1 lipid-binding START domain protein [Mucilaginibacter paludis DSM 18603]
MGKKIILLLIWVLVHSTAVYGQEAWKLAVLKEGIKVYTRPVVNSKFKAIKVECSLPVHPSQLVAAIMDIDNSYQWVYHSKVNRIIKRVSPSELYYYSEVSVPWPAENRDYISHIMVSQNPKTKVTTIDAPCIAGMVPEKNNVVRITHSIGKWTIWPYVNNGIKVEYELEVDPSGSVPAWLINLFITQGPLETFQKLEAYLQKKDYKEAKLGFIAD